jgi:hypothetical protein
MATYGIYQVLDPLYVTPTGSVCSAKIVGGEATGRIAAKVFNPTKADPDEPNWEPKYFLDRAHVQRRVAASGGAHWAPIYALGFTPDGGAYYITDYHALTAQKMIDGRVPVDAAALHAMEEHAWLVNVGRGGHVVTDDLVAALRDGTIAGAGLDVTHPEPLPDGHPLWELPNCIITPHTANTLDMVVPQLTERIRENVRRFGAGEPLVGLVDPELGY